MRRTWRRFVLEPPVLFIDSVLAAALLALTWPVSSLQAAHAGAPLDAGAGLLIATASASLALRRRVPLLAFAVSAVASAAYLLSGRPWGPILLSPAIALLTVVALAEPRVWVAATLAGAALLGVAHGLSAGWNWATLGWTGGWLLVPTGFGVTISLRRRLRAEAEAGAAWARRGREAEERLTLAREVHDVVGHSLAVISLQAGVAEHLLERNPEEARRAVGAIRDVSRRALNDLRAELTALRAPANRAAPAPGVEAIPELIESMRRAGLRLALEVQGERDLPAAVSAAGYRIVQESLTNVARHAGSGTAAEVRLRADDGGLEVEVVDGGPGARGERREAGGLTGMRERAEALGGRFLAGDRPEGGFRVWAWLPLAAR